MSAVVVVMVLGVSHGGSGDMVITGTAVGRGEEGEEGEEGRWKR